MKEAYLENSKDPELAAYVGFLHIWRLSERSRLKQIPPEITDNAVLSRKYIGEAVSLDPSDARYLGFHGILLMTGGKKNDDQYLIRKGYYQELQESISGLNLICLLSDMSWGGTQEVQKGLRKH